MSEKDTLINDKNSENSKNKLKYYSNDKVGCIARRKRSKLLNKYIEEKESLEKHYELDKLLLQGQMLEDPTEERRPDRILAKIALILNCFLLVVNLGASVISGSLAIISTFVDAFMDITSSAIIALCLGLIHRTNAYKYPRGRAKLEVVGVMFCSVIMGFSNMVLFLTAIRSIIDGGGEEEVNFIVLAIMLGGSFLKGVMMIACYKRGTPSSLVLAMDMRNDTATALVATACAFIGANYWKYADPVGAIIVCGLISISWFRHALENVPQLVGIRADKENMSRILKVAIEHDERIRGIDYIQVYHTGATTIVELHIIMDENLPLKVTHDISHPLERKLMKLPFVERAFVHCDYRADGEGDDFLI